MLFVLISSISFAFFFSKSLCLQPLPQWVHELRLLSILLCQELLSFLVQWLKNSSSVIAAATLLKNPPKMSTKTEEAVPRAENVEETSEISVLDLPELVLECILGRLSPDGMCNMSVVCSSLTERCRSDHLWQRHMKEKWGRVIGKTAQKEWELYVASSKESFSGGAREGKAKGWIWSVSCLWALSWLQSKTDSGSTLKAKIDSASKLRTSLPVDSLMSWYLSLESGKFWFPAQVYNRENGHVGFMLSCYDAELSYDYGTDTFHARYPPHGRRTIVIEEGVQWNRIRVSPVDTCPLDLHLSDCLNDLRPGDHIEIQWRRNKEFPYGWWYGVVGHLESCDRNDLHCQCHSSDTAVLEFNQYAPGSRWRRAFINRKDHREEGNEGDGFYGGIRKIYDEEEISTWRKLWPTEKLE